MAAFDPSCPYADRLFFVKAGAGYDNLGFNLDGSIFQAEAYCKNVFGEDWRSDTSLIPIKVYLDRIKTVKPAVPDDEEVLYGKIGMFGYIFHASELTPLEDE